MMHGWQSESTDEPKGGWSSVFFVVIVKVAVVSAGVVVVAV